VLWKGCKQLLKQGSAHQLIPSKPGEKLEYKNASKFVYGLIPYSKENKRVNPHKGKQTVQTMKNKIRASMFSTQMSHVPTSGQQNLD
jgi:hypothetical protein